ncbi:hypothetical protein AAVH_28852 [Aphelenchoides avenae]|nr:hypothetical protein AAVH_28852 [Aphelenchus avenae]
MRILVDAEREFAKKYGVSIDYLREVEQRAKQGHVGLIEAEDIKSTGKREGELAEDAGSKLASHEPHAKATIEETKVKDCNPPHALPEQRRTWKAPTRVKAASRPDNGVALVILVVVVIAAVLTAFIVIMWRSYSCLV